MFGTIWADSLPKSGPDFFMRPVIGHAEGLKNEHHLHRDPVIE